MSIAMCLLLGFTVWVVLAWMVRDELYPSGFFIGLVIACGLSWLFFGEQTESRKEWDRAEAAREEAERQPRVIREADGCKVYAFKAGDRWHYFTRCANQTTTDSSYTVRSGKTSRTETESITTTNTTEPTHER